MGKTRRGQSFAGGHQTGNGQLRQCAGGPQDAELEEAKEIVSATHAAVSAGFVGAGAEIVGCLAGVVGCLARIDIFAGLVCEDRRAGLSGG